MGISLAFRRLPVLVAGLLLVAVPGRAAMPHRAPVPAPDAHPVCSPVGGAHVEPAWATAPSVTAAVCPLPESEDDEAGEVPPPIEPPPGVAPGPAGNPEDAQDNLADTLLSPTMAVETPGTDTNLCMSWEMTATSDPHNRRRVVLIQGTTVAVSTDGGDNFTFANAAAGLPSGYTSAGDGSVAFDRRGRLFVSFLGDGPGIDSWAVFVSRLDPATGAVLAGPVNVSQQVSIPPSFTSDKPWIAADSNPLSPYANRLYVVWSVTGGAFSGQFEIWGAYSTDQGASWSQMVRDGVNYGPISPLDASDGRCWPPHIAVGADGDVFVSYHSQTGFLADPGGAGSIPDGVSGKIVMLRSSDGGVTFPDRSEPFPAGMADTTFNMQDRFGTIPDARFWTTGTGQAWLLPDPDDGCTVHVVTTDDPDDDHTSGDAADVVMATTDDCGSSWTRQTVASGPAESWQLLPTAAIDPIQGSIAVTWLDNRNAASYPTGSAGNARVDLYAAYSLSGGTTWLPPLIVNDDPIDPDASTSTIGSGSPSTYRIGEYNALTFAACTAHMAWPGQATCNGSMDTYYDRDREVGDLDEPIIFCPDDVTLGCHDSIDPSRTGTATARDLCDPDPSVIHVDDDLGGSCPPTPVISSLDRIWSATDAAGNIVTCTQHISVQDFDPPDIVAPLPLHLECSTAGGAPSSLPVVQAWLGLAEATDECSDASLSISTLPPVLPVGCNGETNDVIFSAADECGNSDFAVSSIAVTDLTPPAATAPADATFECTQAGGIPATAPDVAAWLAAATASDVCSAPVVTTDAPALLPAACDPGSDTLVTFTATDGCGNQDAAAATATVVDTTPPVLPSPATRVLAGPPDHTYRCFNRFAAGVGARDACQTTPLDFAVSCTSSQCDDAPCPAHPGEDGDGDTVDDCVYDPVMDRLCARAERAETNPEGRVYTVELGATDSCGNSRHGTVLKLFVPHGCAEGDGACLFSDGFESGDAVAWSATAP